MRLFLWKMYPLLHFLAEIGATGVGKAWRVSPYKMDYGIHPSWPRLDSSAFEVRTVSGVGHLVPFETMRRSLKYEKTEFADPNAVPRREEDFPFDESTKNPRFQHYERVVEDRSPGQGEDRDREESRSPEKILKAGIAMTVLRPSGKDDKRLPEEVTDFPKKLTSRVRRDAENETRMEQIATAKNVREVRTNSQDTWSTQPISVEFRHRASLDQMIQQAQLEADEDSPGIRGHAPRADFVTSHHRRSYENREQREMPVTNRYDDYEFPYYGRNVIRDRDYDSPSIRRGLSYYYPERFRTERDYYMRLPNEQSSYYYDRYKDDDFDLYGRSRPAPKPKRIIYYATLPEIVRKPVDLRNYPRTYDGIVRTPISRDGNYKRVPGNVDPGRYRYRHPYDGYDSYSKRSSFYDRPAYTYPEEENRRKVTLAESLRNQDGFDRNNERKLANQISARNDGKLPWPVQIGTEVSVKDDERIPGRKIFGENTGYERFQSAQLQKAPDATGSSELQSDN